MFLHFHVGFGSRLLCYCFECYALVDRFIFRLERQRRKKMRDANSLNKNKFFKFIKLN